MSDEEGPGSRQEGMRPRTQMNGLALESKKGSSFSGLEKGG